jgi:hypothetical protein
MTLDEIKTMVGRCASPNFEFIVSQDDEMRSYRPFLQVKFWALDAATNKRHEQTGRKWMLSWHMTKSEIVQTCFLAVKTAVEHETRENFTYNDRAVFGPHIDIEAAWYYCTHLDVRPPR